MDLRKETTVNLYHFYGEIASMAGARGGEICGIPYTGDGSAGWPAYLLGGAAVDRETMDQVAKAIVEGSVPPFWIRECGDEDDFEALAQAKGIRPINRWTGMQLVVPDAGFVANIDTSEAKRHGGAAGNNAAVSHHSAVSHSTVVRQVAPEALPDWLELVNTEVMTSMKIGWSRIASLAGSDKFHFFGLWHQETLVSTALLYLDQGIAGLYFIATRSSARGKGFGYAVVSAAIDYGLSQGISKFVLHSTPMGIPLYRKLGFVANATYGIYWMLGKR